MKKADGILKVLLAVVALSSGVFDFMAPPQLVESFGHLALPLYYLPYFGALKVLGALGLFSPMVLKNTALRTGAQWGLVFYFSGAAITHVLANDVAKMGAPTVLTALAVASLVVFLRTAASGEGDAVGGVARAATA